MSNSFPLLIGTFFALGSVPYFSPTIVSSLQLGLIGEMVASYAVPFCLNWLINFLSNYYHYWSNCNGVRTAYVSAIAFASIAGSVVNLVLSMLLNFIPILKTPLLFLSIFGGMWIVDMVINILANYNPALVASTFAVRMGILKTQCKKVEKKK